MASRRRKWLVAASATLGGIVLLGYLGIRLILRDPIAPAYEDGCAGCHGEALSGTPIGPPLVGRALRGGESVDAIAKSIADGVAQTGMPAFKDVLPEGKIRGLAILIAEKRANYSRNDFMVTAPILIPTDPIVTEEHTFRIEPVASELHPLPFSIAPLADGRILVTEKARGLSVIDRNGQQSALIAGTPPAHDDGFEMFELVYGSGWLLDVAPHPDFEENGWIYLHFGDRCAECAASMNKVVRGRIEHGRWIDQETIWEAAPDTYTETPDMGAGGRLAFDDAGHVFLSVGIKGLSNHHGIQDLRLPYGKIHRVNDDGTIPPDNPFTEDPDALDSTWSYGHRSPQGLEFDPETGHLWSTEMGPRGGDEFNLIRPGRNYGWPLTSKGVDYDGTPVEYGIDLGIPLDLDAIEQPVVDLTPAPAVSSFALYYGDTFPAWRGNAIVGTLKATELYRFVIDGDHVTHRETLLSGMGRLRDVEVGADGAIYLLLEHATGGRVVRMVPE